MCVWIWNVSLHSNIQLVSLYIFTNLPCLKQRWVCGIADSMKNIVGFPNCSHGFVPHSAWKSSQHTGKGINTVGEKFGTSWSVVSPITDRVPMVQTWFNYPKTVVDRISQPSVCPVLETNWRYWRTQPTWTQGSCWRRTVSHRANVRGSINGSWPAWATWDPYGQNWIGQNRSWIQEFLQNAQSWNVINICKPIVCVCAFWMVFWAGWYVIFGEREAWIHYWKLYLRYE